ncbi:MAG: flagellar biosynthesis protein FlgA [Pseudomonadota bacterium]|jgi:flagellar P-ring protein precursor FlgI
MRIIVLLFVFLWSVNLAHADTRIKDIATFDGLRDNLLVGYGLAVGLNNTGDNLQNAIFTQQGIVDFLERLGVNVNTQNTAQNNLKTKNIAAVMVTANLPPFARQGSRIDIKVSAIGDAKSIRGGTLLATPLLAANGDVYAVAQGHIAIPNFNPASEDVKTRGTGIETNGFIQSGAIVENELDYDLKDFSHLRLALNSPDFTTAINIANAINDHVTGNTASALDAATVHITIPNYRKVDIVEFMAEIESLNVQPDYKAKVVINESTGTVVIGDNVRIRPVAIAQGNLIINVGDQGQSGYSPTTQPTKQARIDSAINKRRGMGTAMLDGSASLSELVAGLNKLGVYPRDIVNILHNMKSVGALDATIEVK